MGAPYLTELYGEINQGAHRKAAENIGAPALIWHQALWNSRHDPKKSKRRAKRIEAYLKALHKHLAIFDKEVQPDFSSIRVGITDRARVITFRLCWQGMRVKIRFEVHTEYLTITSILDLSVDLSEKCRLPKARMSAEYPIYAGLKSRINSLSNLLSKNSGLLYDPHDKYQQYLSQKLSDSHAPLYTTFWESEFDFSILDIPLEGGRRSRRWLSSGMLGRRFADFRGVVTSEFCPDVKIEELEPIDFGKIDKHSIQRPFYKTSDESPRGQAHRIEKPTSKWARYRLNAAWPFLEPAQNPLPGRTEYTVSRLLGGRILYVTALGPQPMEDMALPGLERPVFFYIHSITRCERQIGRTIDWLVQLGTLRLAAIMAIPALKEIAQRLREVENNIHEVRVDIHNLIEASNWKGDQSILARNRQKLEEKVNKNLAKIQEDMSGISAGDDENQSLLGDESIDYRLVRSRYYRTLFERQLGALRIKRLEGYQPYDEFVQRRLEGAFGFIEGIERRIREIKEEWRSLDQLYLATNVTILTGEIDKQQAAIKRIQLFGEFILLCVFSPYYMSMIWTHIKYPVENSSLLFPLCTVNKTLVSCISSSKYLEEVHSESISKTKIWIAFLVLGVSSWVLKTTYDRFFGDKSDRKIKKKRYVSK